MGLARTRLWTALIKHSSSTLRGKGKRRHAKERAEAYRAEREEA